MKRVVGLKMNQENLVIFLQVFHSKENSRPDGQKLVASLTRKKLLYLFRELQLSSPKHPQKMAVVFCVHKWK